MAPSTRPGIRDLINILVAQKPRNYIGILTRLQRLIELAVEERAVRMWKAPLPLADKGASVFADLERRQFGPASSTILQGEPCSPRRAPHPSRQQHLGRLRQHPS